MHVPLRKHAHAILYTEFFKVVKNENFQLNIFHIFLIFAQNRLWVQMVLTSIHNLCFGLKIRTIGIPLHTPVLLYKWGTCQGHVFLMCGFVCPDLKQKLNLRKAVPRIYNMFYDLT